MLASSIGQIPQVNAGNRNGDDDEYRALGRFQRNNPPVFEGEHELDKAQAWLKAIEKIFRVMNCTDAQRVQFGTHMLEKEAEDRWNNTLQRFEEDGIEVTWDLFRDVFLENYFPEDCRGKKEVEFLELKQGNGTVAVYATKFQELLKYCPHYNTANAERSKCLNRESASIYKSLKGKNQDRGKPYDDKRKQAGFGKKPSWGGSSTSPKCFKCGAEGHKAAECKKEVTTCFKCGKYGHIATNCRGGSIVTCFNCGEKGHISTKCDKPKKEQAKGKVFALSGVGANTDERLIQEDLFLSAKQVDESVQGGAELFMLLATLDVREKRTIEELPIVCEFAEVFPDDIIDLPPEREVEF
ncbi:uncharacterized protein LOC131605379 [Vicia villosa]|uniref:uncharacterized protein LOC131605379 n=1 Tax=Vicia villosa TaxID=3911 RepID=UPI00273C1589|nr:uncharacterized protein LOC131605379 [Vicia villosa]